MLCVQASKLHTQSPNQVNLKAEALVVKLANIGWQ